MFSGLLERETNSALSATLSFTEARLRTIAENIANSSTPGYRAKHLHAKAFQESLKQALQDRSGDDRGPFVFRGDDQMRRTANGEFAFRPKLRPVETMMSHDGTNQSLEREMSDLAETGMMHQLAAEMLRRSWDGMRKAIRGTV